MKTLSDKIRTRMGGSFFILVLLLASAKPTLGFASSSTPVQPGDYTIQLTDAHFFGSLLSVASNIRHRFIGNTSPTFKNIYTFTSSYSPEALKNYLQGEFNYLDAQQILQSADVSVNNPGFTLNAQDVDKEWGLAKAGFPAAWEKTTGSTSNVVAIIDTGVDETHQGLQGINYVPGFDFIKNQGIGLDVDSDDNGHGTLITGVLGATANDGIGIVGGAWQVSVMPLKALDSTGRGDAATVAEAITWAADHGAQFINLSLGGIGFGHDNTLANAITYAFNKNVLIVAAAGNDVAATGGSLDENPVFPVCDDNNYNMVIGVAATDQNDIKADFSNYGRNCIDVDAPGKRILSTINFDPVTQHPAPNSYAYASGTSLAVPFVVAEATLIKTLNPSATNIQIRDQIISTSDPIDDLNLSQCGGASCRGLLGSGRIDVPKALLTPITTQSFSEGDLVKVTDDNDAIYEISGGQKRLVSSFVFNQRFAGAPVKSTLAAQLASYPLGAYITPLDGTLVKFDDSPTVYTIQNGQKLPVTAQVFSQRNFAFAQVNTLSYPELNSWTTGSFLSPLEGSLVKGFKNPTVYWVVGQALHPVNSQFYLDRGLNIFPLLLVPDADIAGYEVGDPYIR